MFAFSDNQKRQALGALIAAGVSGAAIYGLDLSFLNEPWVAGLIFAVGSVLASFITPEKKQEPSLAEAYQKVQAAQQARDAERWAQSRDPSRVLQPDENQRAEP